MAENIITTKVSSVKIDNLTKEQRKIQRELEDRLDEFLKNSKDFFTIETEKVVRSQKQFDILKRKLNLFIQLTESNRPQTIQKYFKAYEFILQVREFFFGKLGEIKYNFVFGLDNGIIIESVLDRVKMKDLLFNKKQELVGLEKNDWKLKFNTLGYQKIKEYVTLLLQDNSFQLKIKDNKNTDFHFSELGWMIKKLDEIRSFSKKVFTFVFKLSIREPEEGKKKYNWKYNEIPSGVALTSSVFSAVGKYAIDEINAKNELLAKEGEQKELKQNIGNLTEVYIQAKNAFNKGHNTFYPNRKRITGGQLYEVFRQVRGNNDPFDMGGDDLDEQIKSFLGSLPSISEFKTIRKHLKEIQKALNHDTLKEIKEEIEKIFIKKQPTIKEIKSNVANKEEKILIQKLKETLLNFELSN